MLLWNIFCPADLEKVGTQKELYGLPEDDPMYCCYKWQKYVLMDPRVPITYNYQMRYFYVMVEKDTPYLQVLPRCLICNKKWPKCLSDVFFKTIQKELGFDALYETNAHLIPQEFKTDEWWKKRGIK